MNRARPRVGVFARGMLLLTRPTHHSVKMSTVARCFHPTVKGPKFTIMQQVRHQCAGTPMTPKGEEEEGTLELFAADQSFAFKIMPFVAVTQLACWGMYAEQSYAFTGDPNQLWYVALGLIFPGALAVLRKHYVTRVCLVEDGTGLRIETFSSILPMTSTRVVKFKEVELSDDMQKRLAGRSLENSLADPMTAKISFKVKGDSSNYLLDNHNQTVDPTDFRVLALALSGSATQRSIKEALRKVRRIKSKQASH